MIQINKIFFKLLKKKLKKLLEIHNKLYLSFKGAASKKVLNQTYNLLFLKNNNIYSLNNNKNGSQSKHHCLFKKNCHSKILNIANKSHHKLFMLKLQCNNH